MFVFAWPPVAVWMESGLWSLDFLISCFLWGPLLQTSLHARTHNFIILGWVASVLHAWYVVTRSKSVPISALEVVTSKYKINFWNILFSLAMIILAPFLVVWKASGFWSLDLLVNIGLCIFAYLRWSSLHYISWYNIHFLFMDLLPCILHAWYIIAISSKELFVYDRYRGWELWEVERRRVRVGGKEQELGEMVERWGIGRLTQR
jgi:uncharacterized membrane protein YqaE (UPF0057 family)